MITTEEANFILQTSEIGEIVSCDNLKDVAADNDWELFDLVEQRDKNRFLIVYPEEFDSCLYDQVEHDEHDEQDSEQYTITVADTEEEVEETLRILYTSLLKRRLIQAIHDSGTLEGVAVAIDDDDSEEIYVFKGAKERYHYKKAEADASLTCNISFNAGIKG